MNGRMRYVIIAVAAIVVVAAIGGCSMLAMRFLWEIKGERRDVMIECPAFDGGRLAEASFLADSMVPNKATDIRLHLSYSRGGFMGGPKDRFGGLGAFADMRCKVPMEGLMEFAKKSSYEFQSESIEKNACTNGPEVPFIDDVWRKYNPGDVPYPTKFLAYNFIHGNCGGYSFLYDVDNETLYATFGSN